MREIGVLEARTQFSALLNEVETTGEAIVITRHGKAVARLTPEPRSRRLTGAELADMTLAFRERQAPDRDWASLSWEEVKAIARDEAGR